MSALAMDVGQGTCGKNLDPLSVGTDSEDSDLSRLPEKSNIHALERNRSCDEKSLNELAVLISSNLSSRNIENFRSASDNLESILDTGRSGMSTPRSQTFFESHPMIAEAWEALRRSLVYFRGQPVGTIAALDHTEDALNYNQVYLFLILLHPLFCLSIVDKICITRIVMEYSRFYTCLLLLSRASHCPAVVLMLYMF